MSRTEKRKEKEAAEAQAKADAKQARTDARRAHLEARKEAKIEAAAQSRGQVTKEKAQKSEKPKKSKKTDGEQPERKHPIRKIVFRVFLCLILVCLVATAAVGIYAYRVIKSAPDIDTDNIQALLSESSIIYDDAGNELDTIYSNANRNNVSITVVPKHVKYAFIALEDKSFETHHGFNVVRIFGAIWESLTGGGQISGTSTITQQLARNLYLKDSQYDYDIKRKIIEAYYTIILEQNLTKDEILEAYLNYIYFGNNSYGIESASEAYFSCTVSDLTLAQAAALAALPQAPTDYQLVRYVEGGTATEYQDVLLKETSEGVYIYNDTSKERRVACLDLMLDQGYITKEERDAAAALTLPEILNPNYELNSGKGSYFVDYAIEEVIQDLMLQKGYDRTAAENLVYNGGLRIHTTLDSQAQEAVEAGFADPDNYPAVSPGFDDAGNIVNRNGTVTLYDFYNFFDESGNFTLTADEATLQDDGSLKILYGKRLNIYTTEVSEGIEYSLEFKSMYTQDDNGTYYAISGGYINVPATYKTLDDEGNLIISAEFMSSPDYPNFFINNGDGTFTIPPSSYKLNPKTIQPQAAMTIIENSTGHIKAMQGGRNTEGRMLMNRATNPRQPGSSIKPLSVYSAALQQSANEVASGEKHVFVDNKIDKQGAKYYGDYMTAASIVVDEPVNVAGWSPKNAFSNYAGPLTMREALHDSVNTCAVKIVMQIGVDTSVANVERFGITTLSKDGETNDLNIAAMALGGMTHGVTTLEMASAYSVFPNNGTRMEPVAYTTVTDRNGNVLLETRPVPHEVLDPGVAWIMTNMLQSTVAYNGYGYVPGEVIGGKTGTTDDNYDIWFDGFTANYTASLWIGNDNNFELASMSPAAAAMWGNIMSNVNRCYGGYYPDAPGNVTNVGGEYFIVGTEGGLTKKDDLKTKEVVICKESGYLACPDCPVQEKRSFSHFATDEEIKAGMVADDAPKYYCNKHNVDPTKYPIDPEKTLEPFTPPKKPEEGDGSGDPGSGGGDPGSGGGNPPPVNPTP